MKTTISLYIDQKLLTSSKEAELKEALMKFLPATAFDIVINQLPEYETTSDKKYHKFLRTNCIMVGYGMIGSSVEGQANYKRKYLISPGYRKAIQFYEMTKYDAESTYCYFGGTIEEKEIADIYAKHYPQTTVEETENEIDLISILESISLTELLYIKGEKDKHQSKLNA